MTTNGALSSVQQLFNDRVFRVPDYQRGYAWGERELGEFWDDVVNLEDQRVHYTGLVMLEAVPPETHSTWEGEQWLIRDRGYEPVYIVDGQQRLTTTIMLIHLIADRLSEGERVASLTAEEIRERYIRLGGDGLAEAYVFGYEKDDPSDQCLRERVFGDHPSADARAETLYTRRLMAAKAYFSEQLDGLDDAGLDGLFRKLTQWVRFNVYVAEEDLDASVVFETMNNRGKPLSTLELLKNRLIYLASKLDSPDDRSALRAVINAAWKDIYGYLGRNAENPLNDEAFLRAHFLSYFAGVHRSSDRDPYADELLKNRFTLARLRSGDVTAEQVRDYARSLRRAARRWFLIRNPSFESDSAATERDEWLERIERLGMGEFGPVLIALPVESVTVPLVRALSEIERYLYVVFRFSRRRANTGRDKLHLMAHQISSGKLTLDRFSERLAKLVEQYFDIDRLLVELDDWFDRPSHHTQIGFYAWSGLRYTLFEYETHLRAQAKGHTPKLSWRDMEGHKKGLRSVEHVYPQTPKSGEWSESFNGYKPDERKRLCNSLGNLIPLSVPKNSSLGNRAFGEKKKGSENWPGYSKGSYSELDVASREDWEPDDIFERGLSLASFIEKRWGVDLGDREGHVDFLGLSFTGM